MAPIIAEIAKQYEDRHPSVLVDVQTGGSARGMLDARKELADIGMVSRKLTPAESDLKNFTVAIDAVILFTHDSNKVADLSHQDVADIYTGALTNWSAVGGAEADIVVVSKAEGRSTLELFLEHFKLKSSDIAADVIIGDNEQAIKVVAANPNAIGFVSSGTLTYHIKHGAPLQALSLEGLGPEVMNMSHRDMPMTRELNLVTARKPEGAVADFIAYATSDQVIDILKAFYVFAPTR